MISDPVKNIDQMNTALQKGIGGMWIQPDDRSPRASGHPQGHPDRRVLLCSVGHPATMQGDGRPVRPRLLSRGFGVGRRHPQQPRRQGDRRQLHLSTTSRSSSRVKKGRPGRASRPVARWITLIEQEAPEDLTRTRASSSPAPCFQAHPDIHVWRFGLGRYRPRGRRLPEVEEARPGEEQDPVAGGLNGTDAGLSGRRSRPVPPSSARSTAFNNKPHRVRRWASRWPTGSRGLQISAGRAGCAASPCSARRASTTFKELTADPGGELQEAHRRRLRHPRHRAVGPDRLRPPDELHRQRRSRSHERTSRDRRSHPLGSTGPPASGLHSPGAGTRAVYAPDARCERRMRMRTRLRMSQSDRPASLRLGAPGARAGTSGARCHRSGR